jgi:hypothetical protein
MSIANESFLANFGFTPENVYDLAQLLTDTHGFIAGGAALYWFLGVESPAGQDLDIWIPTHGQKNSRLNTAYNKMIAEMFEKLGFRQTEDSAKRHTAEMAGRPTDLPYHHNPEFQRIVKRIYDFTAPRCDRKVQLIFYYPDTDPLASFDLDVCKIAVRPDSEPTTGSPFVFDLPAGLDEAEVRARRMRVTNKCSPETLEQRVMKYMARGFELVAE